MRESMTGGPGASGRSAGAPHTDARPGQEVLADEDFADFPIGPFPYDYSPAAEYHDVQPQGYRGRWREATVLHPWRGAASWNVVDTLDGRAMEQSCVRDRALPMLVTGNPYWTDYAVGARVRPLFAIPEAGRPVVAPMASVQQGLLGLIARYRDNRNYYALLLTSENTLQLARSTHEGITCLASRPLVIDCDHTYDLVLEVVGDRLVGFVDGERALEATDATFRAGGIGILANVPVRFASVLVTGATGAGARARRQLAEDERALLAERERYPQPRLERTISTPGFGTSKHVRFADLDGDGRKEILLAEGLDRGPFDAYRMIACLTAIDLEGRVLWQFGRPTAFHGQPTSDLAFQVYDLDRDGSPEVILTKDFQILVLDGRTGRIKRSAPTPHARAPESMFYRTIGDSLAIANLRGLAAPQDILLKDRYHNVWAFDDRLRLLWTDTGVNTGHFPSVYDLDGDGKDEVVVGYNCLDHDGRPLWRLTAGDHADGIAIGRFDPDRPDEVEIRMPAGDEGLLWVSLEGEIRRRDRTGHVQRISIANYRPDLPGLEMVSVTFWGNPGILSYYDADGTRYTSLEPNHQGSPLHPVNWAGDGQELVLFSGSAREGGLLDGWGRRVVPFPDDGHPERCCEAVDLLGDGRDELVVWDYDRMYVYTQDRPFSGERIYAPKRVLPYNVSNYKAEISLPGWTDSSLR